MILFWKFEYLYDNDKKIYIYIMNVGNSMGLVSRQVELGENEQCNRVRLKDRLLFCIEFFEFLMIFLSYS